MRIRPLALALLALFVSAAPLFAAEYVIVIDKMAFGPAPETLREGDVIVWRNDDIFRHTATARDGSFDVDLPAGEAVSMVVGAPGTIAYFCRFHPDMKGTLTIAP